MRADIIKRHLKCDLTYTEHVVDGFRAHLDEDLQAVIVKKNVSHQVTEWSVRCDAHDVVVQCGWKDLEFLH